MQHSPLLVTIFFAASCAVIALGTYVVTTGRTPRLPWRPFQFETQARVRAQGAGTILIGAVLLLSALAVNFGSNSPVRSYWILAVWIALIGGLLGVRFMIDRSGRSAAARERLK